MKKNCLLCGKEFYKKTTTSLHDWNTSNKFCSFFCGNTYRRGKPSGRKGKKIPQITGKNHYKWKGDKVGIAALHTWVVRNLGKPTTCEHCGKADLTYPYIHWANKSGEYKRDLSDWLRLCVKCHVKYDEKIGKRHSPTTEFQKGSIPWNKGIKKRLNTGRTHFKKGQPKSENWYNSLRIEPPGIKKKN